MFWLLLALLLLVCLALLALSLLTLWQRVKVLGGSVATASSTMSAASSTINAATAAGPLGQRPCPTCGAPASAATKTPAAVHG